MEYAIQNGIRIVEAGAQGSHKLARGYMPQTTHSAHFITHPGLRDAVQKFLEYERKHVEQHTKILAEHGPFKKTKKNEVGKEDVNDSI